MKLRTSRKKKFTLEITFSANDVGFLYKFVGFFQCKLIGLLQQICRSFHANLHCQNFDYFSLHIVISTNDVGL